MGCCCSKDDSGNKYSQSSGSDSGGVYPQSDGINHRHTVTRTERNNSQVQPVSNFSDINRTPISFTTVPAPNSRNQRGRQATVATSTRCLPTGNTGHATNPLEYESWYFGKIDINRCIKVLGGRNVPDGTFIVRDSTSRSGTLCISVKGRCPKGPAIFSIRVMESQNRFGEKHFQSSIDDKVFSSIHDAIQYYKDHGIHSNGVSVYVGEGLQNQHVYLDKGGNGDRSLKIKSKDMDLTEKIGEGHFGTVWKGIWKNPHGRKVYVAVKKLYKSDKNELEKFEKETDVMKMVIHDNIVTLVGVCYEGNHHPLIVTELMSKGDLLKFLRANKETPVGDLYYFAHQVASGMKFLASKNVIHRDLAARNVLLGEQHIVKIADFGLSRVLIEDKIYTSSTANPVPVKWTAPEGLDPPRQFSSKSDVWSYGIFLTELITRGREPYHPLKIHEITKDRLIYQGLRMLREKLGDDCSISLYAVMEKCWQSDPDQRPDFKTVEEDIHRLYKPFVPLRHC